jgi:hypothetical protein
MLRNLHQGEAARCSLFGTGFTSAPLWAGLIGKSVVLQRLTVVFNWQTNTIASIMHNLRTLHNSRSSPIPLPFQLPFDSSH